MMADYAMAIDKEERLQKDKSHTFIEQKIVIPQYSITSVCSQQGKSGVKR